ncbi:MAG: hypothetical protein Q7R95_11210 [bacterium]|nr:hypothetical protein [bacterium]
MKIKNKKIIIEEFNIDPYRGFVAFAAGLQKPGYKQIKIERKPNKAKVYFEEI